MTQLIALKLGSTITTIYKRGEGLVLKEPSMIAISRSGRSREIKAVGKDAKRMQGRVSQDVQVISPIASSNIVDNDLATAMLKMFIKRIMPRTFLKPHIKAILCVPLAVTPAEKKNFEKVCYGAGIDEVTLIPALICSALGDDIQISSSTPRLFVNIGGGSTNIAIISSYSVTQGVNLSIGGTSISAGIDKMLAEKYNLSTSAGTSEYIKNEVYSLLENDGSTVDVQGIDLTTKQSQTVTVSSSDVYPIVKHYYTKICEAILSIVDSLPENAAIDIQKEGIYVFGSHAYLPGLVRFFTKKLGIKTNLSETFKTDIHGAAKLLDNPTMLHEIVNGL